MSAYKSVVAGLKWMRYGTDVLYFDDSGKAVVAIEHEEKFTYVERKNSNGEALIRTILPDESSVLCNVNLNDVFIVPLMDMWKEAHIVRIDRTTWPEIELPRTLFKVVDYGIAKSPNFKGCDFSNSVIRVLVTNSLSEYFTVPFIVENGVVGCSDRVMGLLYKAYRFEPIDRKRLNCR